MTLLDEQKWKIAFTDQSLGVKKSINLCVVEKCESTMILARQVIAGQDIPLLINSNGNCTAIFALNQTNGKGRKSRVWESHDSGGMYLSIADKRGYLLTRISGISLSIGLAIHAVLVRYGLFPKLKWPNDVFVGDKKISGILIESTIRSDDCFIVCGVGLNINQSSFKIQSATSMSIELETQLPYEQVCADVVCTILEYIERHMKLGFSALKEEWWEKSLMRDREFTNLELNVRGRAIGINDDGSLRIQQGDGSIRDIYVGDVS